MPLPYPHSLKDLVTNFPMCQFAKSMQHKVPWPRACISRGRAAAISLNSDLECPVLGLSRIFFGLCFGPVSSLGHFHHTKQTFLLQLFGDKHLRAWRKAWQQPWQLRKVMQLLIFCGFRFSTSSFPSSSTWKLVLSWLSTFNSHSQLHRKSTAIPCRKRCPENTAKQELDTNLNTSTMLKRHRNMKNSATGRGALPPTIMEGDQVEEHSLPRAKPSHFHDCFNYQSYHGIVLIMSCII